MAFYDPADLVEVTRELRDDEDAEGVAIVEIDKRRMVVDGIRSPKDIRLLPEEIRRAIVGWSYDRNQNFTIKLADKSKALDQLARHLSLYNDRIEVKTLDGLADRLGRAKERASEKAEPIGGNSPSVIAEPVQVASKPADSPGEPAQQAHTPILPLRRPDIVPNLKPDWQDPPPSQPAYMPILPRSNHDARPWPDRPAFADADYDPTS
ncbi:hypothetical protein AB4144_17880, partial [Rhizobiaceae sp. 2RAB30]